MKIRLAAAAASDEEVQLLTVPEAAKRLGVSPRTAYRYVKEGLLTPTYLPAGDSTRTRVSITTLAEFIARHTAA